MSILTKSVPIVMILLCTAFTFGGCLGEKQREMELLKAAEAGDLDTVKHLLQRGVDPDVKDTDGTTALMYPVMRNNRVLAHVLLEAGADPNAADAGGMSSMHYAACNGNRSIVSLLLDRGGSALNACAATGWSPVHFAAVHGHEKLVRDLVTHTPRLLNSRTARGNTPVLVAAKRLQRVQNNLPYRESLYATVASLLELGADISVWDEQGRTLNDIAADGDDKRLLSLIQ